MGNTCRGGPKRDGEDGSVAAEREPANAGINPITTLPSARERQATASAFDDVRMPVPPSGLSNEVDRTPSCPLLPPPPPLMADDCACRFTGQWSAPGQGRMTLRTGTDGTMWCHPEDGQACALQPATSSEAAPGGFPAQYFAEWPTKKMWLHFDRVLQCRVTEPGADPVPMTYRIAGAPAPPMEMSMLGASPSSHRPGGSTVVSPGQPRIVFRPPPGPLPSVTTPNGIKWQIGVSLVGGGRMGRNNTITTCDAVKQVPGHYRVPGLRIDIGAPYWQALHKRIEFINVSSFKIFGLRDSMPGSLEYVHSPSDSVLLILKDKSISVEYEGTSWSFVMKPRTKAGSVEEEVVRSSGLHDKYGQTVLWGIRGPLPAADWVVRPLSFGTVKDGQRFRLDLKSKMISVHGDDRLADWPVGRASIASQRHRVQVDPQDTTIDIRRKVAECFALDKLAVSSSSWYLEYGKSRWLGNSQLRVPEKDIRYRSVLRGTDTGDYTLRFLPKRVDLVYGSMAAGKSSGGTKRIPQLEIRPEASSETHKQQVARVMQFSSSSGLSFHTADSPDAPRIILTWSGVRDGGSYYVYSRGCTIRVWWDVWEGELDGRCSGEPFQDIEVGPGDKPLHDIAQRFNVEVDLFDLLEKGTGKRQWRVGEKVMVQYDSEGDQYEGWFPATVTHSAGPEHYNVRFEDGSCSAGVHTNNIHRYVTEADLDPAQIIDQSEYMIVLRPKSIRVGILRGADDEPGMLAFEGEKGVPPGQTPDWMMQRIATALGMFDPETGEAFPETVTEGNIWCFELEHQGRSGWVQPRATAWSTFSDWATYNIVLRPKTVRVEFNDGRGEVEFCESFEVTG
eukprot:Hpha_TRINITY_DN12229_c0_g1::TRINITY_DN12229_c0_g1_i1::g.16620::m.16620